MVPLYEFLVELGYETPWKVHVGGVYVNVQEFRVKTRCRTRRVGLNNCLGEIRVHGSLIGIGY